MQPWGHDHPQTEEADPGAQGSCYPPKVYNCQEVQAALTARFVGRQSISPHEKATSTILAARPGLSDFSARGPGLLVASPLITLPSPREAMCDLRPGPGLSICCSTSI